MNFQNLSFFLLRKICFVYEYKVLQNLEDNNILKSYDSLEKINLKNTPINKGIDLIFPDILNNINNKISNIDDNKELDKNNNIIKEIINNRNEKNKDIIEDNNEEEEEEEEEDEEIEKNEKKIVRKVDK